jgi:hypothetical protein
MEGAFGQVMTNDPDLSGRNEPSTETAQGIFAVAARGNHRWLPGLSAHGDDYLVEEAKLTWLAGRARAQGKGSLARLRAGLDEAGGRWRSPKRN